MPIKRVRISRFQRNSRRWRWFAWGTPVSYTHLDVYKRQHFAFGTGRTPGDPSLEAMMDAKDVAEAVLFAVTQPPKVRVFLIGMRPMSEPL